MEQINKVRVNLTIENLDKLQKLLETAAEQSKQLKKSIDEINNMNLTVSTNLVEGD